MYKMNNTAAYFIIFGLIMHGTVNCHPKGHVVGYQSKTTSTDNTSKLSSQLKSDSKINQEKNSITNKLLKSFLNADEKLHKIRKGLFNSLDKKLNNNKYSASYIQQPVIYPQVLLTPPISPVYQHQQPSASNTVSTSNSASSSHSVVHPNGATTSVSSSQATSFSQGISQTAPIQPISPPVVGPVSGTIPFPPSIYSFSKPITRDAINGAQSQSVATSSGQGFARAQASSVASAGASPYGSYSTAQAQVSASLLPQRGKRSFKESVPNNNEFEASFQKTNRQLTITQNILKMLALSNKTKNLGKIQQNDNNENEDTIEPRTFNLIIDAINGFLNPTPPPCHPPCSVPPQPIPPIPPPPCQPVAPCQPYPYCPMPPCYPPCQPVPPCHASPAGYHPPFLPNQAAPPMSIPPCDSPKYEKIVRGQEQNSRNELLDNDDSREEVSGSLPCYKTGTSPLTLNPSSSIPQNSMHPPLKDIHIGINSYPVYLAEYIYPNYLPNVNNPVNDRSSVGVSSTAINNGPFSSSSVSTVETVSGINGNIYDYFQSYTQASLAQQSPSGIVGLVGFSSTTIKRLANGSCEIERVFTVPCQNGSLYQIKLVTLETENQYPKQIFQTVNVIPYPEKEKDSNNTKENTTTTALPMKDTAEQISNSETSKTSENPPEITTQSTINSSTT